MMSFKDKIMVLLVVGRNVIYGYYVEIEIMGIKGML